MKKPFRLLSGGGCIVIPIPCCAAGVLAIVAVLSGAIYAVSRLVHG